MTNPPTLDPMSDATNFFVSTGVKERGRLGFLWRGPCANPWWSKMCRYGLEISIKSIAVGFLRTQKPIRSDYGRFLDDRVNPYTR
ncbi:hypothetical protein HanIR_Chr11g0541201 [Helianthus annuus]|nr:hypothetical protein HanIR_Chr11g0541201 [Helianthus annuus]